MINLEWLRTFSVIYECRNITEASKKLHMTQPGVSKHLAALENHIGKTLFERTTRKLLPTEYGKFLYNQINHPLQELQKVEYYSGQRSKKARSAITIGCTADFFRNELISKIYTFDMYIVTCFGNEQELVEALETDKVQLLVGIKKHRTYAHQFTFLANENLVLICSKNVHIPEELAQSDHRLMTWLQKQTWFTFDNDQSDIKEFWQTRFNTHPQIVPRYILPSYTDTIEALKHTEGFGIVPKHLYEKVPDKHLLKIPLSSPDPIKQERFYSYKLRNNNLREIHEFKEKMQKASKPAEHT